MPCSSPEPPLPCRGSCCAAAWLARPPAGLPRVFSSRSVAGMESERPDAAAQRRPRVGDRRVRVGEPGPRPPSGQAAALLPGRRRPALRPLLEVEPRGKPPPAPARLPSRRRDPWREPDSARPRGGSGSATSGAPPGPRGRGASRGRGAHRRGTGLGPRGRDRAAAFPARPPAARAPPPPRGRGAAARGRDPWPPASGRASRAPSLREALGPALEAAERYTSREQVATWRRWIDDPIVVALDRPAGHPGPEGEEPPRAAVQGRARAHLRRRGGLERPGGQAAPGRPRDARGPLPRREEEGPRPEPLLPCALARPTPNESDRQRFAAAQRRGEIPRGARIRRPHRDPRRRRPRAELDRGLRGPLPTATSTTSTRG